MSPRDGVYLWHLGNGERLGRRDGGREVVVQRGCAADSVVRLPGSEPWPTPGPWQSYSTSLCLCFPMNEEEAPVAPGVVLTIT